MTISDFKNNVLNSKEAKVLTTIACFLSDATLLTWLYWKASNYEQYGKLASGLLDSPNFQVQLYKVLLQSLTFFLLLFICAQFFVYVLALKKFRAAYFYLKYFVVLGFALALFITLTDSFYALCPALIYLVGYYHFAKSFTATGAQMQSQIQEPKPL